MRKLTKVDVDLLIIAGVFIVMIVWILMWFSR